MQLTSQSLLSGTGFRAVAIGLVALLGLTACGGSDSSSSDYSYAYIQFYNASPNGANVEMREVDGDSFGSAQFGDTTSLLRKSWKPQLFLYIGFSPLYPLVSVERPLFSF